MFVRKFATAGCTALLLALGASVVAAPAGSKADPRVEKAVKSLGYKYEVDEGGALMVEVKTGRTARLVFVDSKTRTSGGVEKRLVLSVARVYNGDVPEEAEELVNKTNKRTKGGQFVILEAGKGKKMVVFAALIEADAEEDTLDETIKTAATQATGMATKLADL
jgi:hypothetical protein